MSDELQKPPDEKENDMETVSEDAPEKEAESPVEDVVMDEEEPGEDDESLVTAEELRAEIEEIGTRVKSAGLKPLRRMVSMYVNQTLDAVDGLLNALEGKKRKKGD
jgi:hypothetical protein